MQTNRKPDTILAIDVGARRIGVARAHLEAAFPAPLVTLDNPDTFIDDIVHMCEAENAAVLVIGLPRGMQGQETAQTSAVRDFGSQLATRLNVPVHWTDEAVTSEQAEAELTRRGKPYAKGDIDALAATYILEDYLREHPAGGQPAAGQADDATTGQANDPATEVAHG